MGRREALTMMIPTWVACLTVMAVGYALGWSGGAVGSAMIGAGSLTIVVSMLVIVRRRSDAH